MDSQNGRVWKGPLEIVESNPQMLVKNITAVVFFQFYLQYLPQLI